jgi:hypothetical protein
MPSYTTIGGYPNSDPYFEPEWEDIEALIDWELDFESMLTQADGQSPGAAEEIFEERDCLQWRRANLLA